MHTMHCYVFIIKKIEFEFTDLFSWWVWCSSKYFVFLLFPEFRHSPFYSYKHSYTFSFLFLLRSPSKYFFYPHFYPPFFNPLFHTSSDLHGYLFTVYLIFFIPLFPSPFLKIFIGFCLPFIFYYWFHYPSPLPPAPQIFIFNKSSITDLQ